MLKDETGITIQMTTSEEATSNCYHVRKDHIFIYERHDESPSHRKKIQQE